MLYILDGIENSEQTKQKARTVTGERLAIFYAHGSAFLSAVADCSGLWAEYGVVDGKRWSRRQTIDRGAFAQRTPPFFSDS